MARQFFTVGTGGEVTLSAGVAKTVLQLATPANQNAAIRSFSVCADGTSGTAEPMAIELVTQTTAGTMTSVTPAKDPGAPGTVQCTAGKNASAEPTTTDIVREYELHPQDGMERVFGGPGDEITVYGGSRIGLRITAPVGVNVRAFFSVEE